MSLTSDGGYRYSGNVDVCIHSCVERLSIFNPVDVIKAEYIFNPVDGIKAEYIQPC